MVTYSLFTPTFTPGDQREVRHLPLPAFHDVEPLGGGLREDGCRRGGDASGKRGDQAQAFHGDPPLTVLTGVRRRGRPGLVARMERSVMRAALPRGEATARITLRSIRATGLACGKRVP